MPYPMFSRLCAQIRNKARSSRPQTGVRTPVVMTPQPMSSYPELLSSPLQNVNSSGSVRTNLRSGDQDSAVSLSPSRLQQDRGQHTETPEPTPQALSGSSRSAVEPTLQHLENSEQVTQGSRAPKRSFSSMQEERVEGNGSKSTTQLSRPGQDTSANPSQRRRYSQSVGPSILNPNASHVQASTAASSPQLAMPIVESPGATGNSSPQTPSPAQPVPDPQQPTGQRPVGQFDIQACRAMQVQARAAHAVPIQPLSAAVAQAQATLLQAALARATQSQAPQPQAQLVDASRAQILQAQYRRSQAPSEMQANHSRASQFESGFNQLVESNGLSFTAAQAGIVLSLKANQEAQEGGAQASSLPGTQSLIEQPLVDPALNDQSAAFPPQSIPSTIQTRPQELSVSNATATPSPAPQQSKPANMEDIPGKGKGVLPHAVAKATFFLDDNEKQSAIGHLARVWAAYRRSSDGSDVKERAALWIVNFSLNFRQQWTLSARSGGTLRRTTLAQLTRSRCTNPSNPASAAGTA